MRRFGLAWCLTVAVSAAGFGCHGDNARTVPDADFYACESETRATPYTKGMTVPSRAGTFAVKVLDSTVSDVAGHTHSQAPVKGNNVWTIEVDDGPTSAPLDALTIAVTPRMPDHPHGTLTPVITPLGGGTYTVDPLYLFMAGYWEIKVDIKQAAGDAGAGGEVPSDAAAAAPSSDTAVFPICISG